MDLSESELRVLGCLLEKQVTTPGERFAVAAPVEGFADTAPSVQAAAAPSVEDSESLASLRERVARLERAVAEPRATVQP